MVVNQSNLREECLLADDDAVTLSWASLNLPGYSRHALAAHDLAERLDLGRVKDGGDGVERLESRGSDLGFEIYHC